MTITSKVIIGSLLSLGIFLFYSLYWLIFTPPDEMVDCKVGNITAVVMYSDCQRLLDIVKAKK